MSYRNIFLTLKEAKGQRNHRFSKFQKSKLPSKVYTKAKTVTKLVEVEVLAEE